MAVEAWRHVLESPEGGYGGLAACEQRRYVGGEGCARVGEVGGRYFCGLGTPEAATEAIGELLFRKQGQFWECLVVGRVDLRRYR